MADYEVSKLMWMAIVISLAASVFVIAKPEIKTQAEGVLDKVEQVVKGIDTGDSENGGDHGEDFKTTSNYGENGTFGIREDGTAELWATDPSKPIVVKDWQLHVNDDNSIAYKTVANGDLKKLTVKSPISLGSGTQMVFANNEALKQIIFEAPVTVGPDASNLFAGNHSLTEIKGIEKFDTSATTNFMGMFVQDRSLKSLDVSTWDTSNGTNFSQMFGMGVNDKTGETKVVDKAALTSLHIKGIDTSKGTDFDNMFAGLGNLDTSWTEYQNLDYSSATNMNAFLNGCSFEGVNLDSTKMPRILDASNMFYNLPNVESVKIGNSKDSEKIKLTNTTGLALKCPSLVTIDLQNTDVSALTADQVVTMWDSDNFERPLIPYTDAIYEGFSRNTHITDEILNTYKNQNA